METIRVVVAEDQYFTREGICSLLVKEPGIVIAGKASHGEEALKLVAQTDADVLLLDISMPPGIDGLEVIKRLRAEGSKIYIIALTENKRLIRMVERLGGNGFVPKDKYQMFIPAIQCVARTGSNIFINPDVSKEYLQLAQIVEKAQLNEVEWGVWRLISFKNEEISRRLNKAPGRIRNIVAELYFKLGIIDNGALSQRMQAVRLAALYGVLEGPLAASVNP